MVTFSDEMALFNFVSGGTVNLVTGAISGDPDQAAEFVASGSGYADGGDNCGFVGAVAQAFSIVFWVRLRVALATPATLDRILTKDGSTGAGRQGWLLYWGGGGQVNAARYVNGAGIFAGTSGVVDNVTWRHIALTYDASALRLYFDTALQSTSGAQTAALVAHTNNLFLNAYNAFGGYSDMQIDELVFYNRALVQSEITNLRNAGVAAAAQGVRFGLRGARRHAMRFGARPPL